MTNPDSTLAARLARLLSGEHELEAELGGPDYDDLNESCGNAYRTNQLITTAEADARVKAAVLAEREAAVILVYEIIYENRHVTLGDKLVAAIRSRGVTG